MKRKIVLEPGDTLEIVAGGGTLVDAFIQHMRASRHKKEYPVYYYALAHLVGIGPAAVVKKANQWARENGHSTINTRDFCRWLANVLSAFFAENSI